VDYGKFRPVEIVREQMHNREQIIFRTKGGDGGKERTRFFTAHLEQISPRLELFAPTPQQFAAFAVLRASMPRLFASISKHFSPFAELRTATSE